MLLKLTFQTSANITVRSLTIFKTRNECQRFVSYFIKYAGSRVWDPAWCKFHITLGEVTLTTLQRHRNCCSYFVGSNTKLWGDHKNSQIVRYIENFSSWLSYNSVTSPYFFILFLLPLDEILSEDFSQAICSSTVLLPSRWMLVLKLFA